MATITERLQVLLSVGGTGKFKSDLKSARRSVETETKGMGSAFKGLATAARLFIGVAVVRYVGQAVLKLANMSEQTRVVGVSFDRLAKSIGQNSASLLAAVRKGVGGAVNDLELMKRTNAAILLGIPATAQGMEEMGRVATRLGRAMGIDVGFALESLVTGIGRQSKLWLDNLGIIVNTEQVYKDLAASLGVSVEALSDTQKKAAFFTATMDAARKKSEELGDQAPALGEKWAQLGAKASNIGVKIGAGLVDPLNNLLNVANAILDLDLGDAGAGMLPEGPGGNVGNFARMMDRAKKKALATAQEKNTIRPSSSPSWQAALNTGKQKYEARQIAADTKQQIESEKVLNQLAKERADLYHEIELSAEAVRRELGLEMDQQAEDAREFADAMTDLEDIDFELDPLSLEKMTDDMVEMPKKMEDEFGNSLLQMEAQMAAFGLRGQGIFGGIANINAGLTGLGRGGTNPLGAGFTKALSTINFGAQIAQGFHAGAMGLSSVVDSIFGSASDRFRSGSGMLSEEAAASTAEDRRYLGILQGMVTQGLDKEDLGIPIQGTLQDEIKRTEEKIREREASSASGGSQTFSSVTTITENQANSMMAILETQRIQDATRNATLDSMNKKLGNIEFFTAVSGASRLIQFQGV